jgi:hypothetical protein
MFRLHIIHLFIVIYYYYCYCYFIAQVYEVPSTSQEYSTKVTDKLGKYLKNWLFINIMRIRLFELNNGTFIMYN